MELSKSKYIEGIKCKKLLWLDTFMSNEKTDINNDSVLENGHKVGDLAKKLFDNIKEVSFNNDLSLMINDTKEYLKNENVNIAEASFNYDNNFCSVDILEKIGNEYIINEVKSSTGIEDYYIDDISYQYYVLKNLGYNVVKTNLIYINNTYIRDGKLDLNKLFIKKDLTDKIIDKQEFAFNKIKEIKEYMTQKKEPSLDIGEYCFTPNRCPFFEYCTRNLPNNNVFKIVKLSNKKKIELYKEGIYTYESLLNTDLNPKFKEQIEFELYNKKPHIDKDKIKEFLKTLYYPLYFLDFETFQDIIPKYDGIKPYMQIPFQYSLHYIEKENDKLLHKEFLAEDGVDPRRSLAERLVKDIPSNACVLAYNMGFEKSVILSLANLYPDLKDHLLNIRSNIKDLMIPFSNRYYYTKEMEGYYTIKKVLPALFPNDPSLDYHNLEGVHNGGEAMNTFANLGSYSEEEKKVIRKQLLKYCELDTYAMVKIREKLIDSV